jgi:translation initiation factor 3 subunit E
MVDFILDLYQKLHNTEEVPQGTHHCLLSCGAVYKPPLFFFKLEFAEKRENVLGQMEDLREKAQKVMDVLEKPEVIAALRQDKVQNFQYLKENYNVRFFFVS